MICALVPYTVKDALQSFISSAGAGLAFTVEEASGVSIDVLADVTGGITSACSVTFSIGFDTLFTGLTTF